MAPRSRSTSVVLMIGLATAVVLALTATGIAARRDLGRDVLEANDGWASEGAGTTGGSAAAADHVYKVTNRAQLLAALDNRSAHPKIIYVSGVIDLNVDDDNQPLACEDYYRDGYTLEAYLAAFDPEVWGRGEVPRGPLESARIASWNAQEARVRVRIGSNTTIVGIDRNATINGGWFDIRGTGTPATVSNIIIRNLRFVDTYDCFPQWDPTDGSQGNWNAQYDSLSVRNADHVWIDHNAFADVQTAGGTTYFGRHYEMHDGQTDITNGSNYVTVSWNRYVDHDKVMLIGSSDSGNTAKGDRGKLKVTIHHNVFDNVGQRAPRVRLGQVHVYNNMYRIKGGANYNYSWGVGTESQIYAEENFFRVEEGFDPIDIISVLKGTMITEWHTLINAASANHFVDVRATYNDTYDPDLGEVAWSPALYPQLDPAYKVQALTSSGAGPFNSW